MQAGTKSSNRKYFKMRKAIASAVAICFLFNSIAYGQIPSQTRFQPVTQVQIPSGLGSIETQNFSSFPDQPLLIHIQDAHANPEGQRNTAKIIHYLAKTYGIRKVFVEGAVENLNAKHLQFVANDSTNQKLIQKLVDLGEVTGAELALGTSGVQFIGIEDVSLYRKNFDLFRGVIGKEPESKKNLETYRQEIDRKASRILGKDALLLFRYFLNFEKENQNWKAATHDLFRIAKKHLNRDFSDAKEQIEFPNLVRLYQLKAEEGNIDFEKAQAEEKAVLKKFGEFSGSTFRDQMERLYQKASPLGFKFESYPHFTSYIRNRIFQQEIEAAPLFSEINLLMESLLSKMLPQEIVREAKKFKLIEGLLTLELTHDEWEKIRTMTLDVPGSDTAKHFYKIAAERESVFIKKIETHLKKSKDPRAIVITGGFHTHGMSRLFDQRRMAHLTIRPKVEEDSTKLYRRGMMRGIEISEVVLSPLAQSRQSLVASLGEKVVAERMQLIAAEANSLGEAKRKREEAKKNKNKPKEWTRRDILKFGIGLFVAADVAANTVFDPRPKAYGYFTRHSKQSDFESAQRFFMDTDFWVRPSLPLSLLLWPKQVVFHMEMSFSAQNVRTAINNLGLTEFKEMPTEAVLDNHRDRFPQIYAHLISDQMKYTKEHIEALYRNTPNHPLKAFFLFLVGQNYEVAEEKTDFDAFMLDMDSFFDSEKAYRAFLSNRQPEFWSRMESVAAKYADLQIRRDRALGSFVAEKLAQGKAVYIFRGLAHSENRDLIFGQQKNVKIKTGSDLETAGMVLIRKRKLSQPFTRADLIRYFLEVTTLSKLDIADQNQNSELHKLILGRMSGNGRITDPVLRERELEESFKKYGELYRRNRSIENTFVQLGFLTLEELQRIQQARASGRSLGETDAGPANKPLSLEDKLAIVKMTFHELSNWATKILSIGSFINLLLMKGEFYVFGWENSARKIEKATNDGLKAFGAVRKMLADGKGPNPVYHPIESYYLQIWDILLRLGWVISYSNTAISEILKNVPLTQNEQEILQQLRRTVAFSDAVNRFTDLVRPEKIFSEGNNRAVDAVKIIETTKALYEDPEYPSEALFAGEKDYKLTMRTLLPGKPLPVRMSIVGLVFLLGNLINNAKRYNATEVLIEAYHDVNSKNVVINVSNNGQPITSERIPLLFKQGESDDKKRTDAGMGLALSKQLLESYGGDISLLSFAGERTTFKIELPYVETSAASLGSAARPVGTAVALGGNAMIAENGPRKGDRSKEAQFENMKEVLRKVLKLHQPGEPLLITHGNGPQVGDLSNFYQELFDTGWTKSVPKLDRLVGATQRQIFNDLIKRAYDQIKKESYPDLPELYLNETRVIVDPDDEAFGRPDKPIGPYYSENEKNKLEIEKGWKFIHIPNKGFRRVVASPKPVSIVPKDLEVIRRELAAGKIVIAVGGGGIPVRYREGDKLEELEGVIDKDRSTALLAKQLNLKNLLIITGVPRVKVGYGTSSEKELSRPSIHELKQYYQAGEFPPGSMGPKVEAVLAFAENGMGRRGIITDVDNVENVFRGYSDAGTIVTAGIAAGASLGIPGSSDQTLEQVFAKMWEDGSEHAFGDEMPVEIKQFWLTFFRDVNRSKPNARILDFATGNMIVPRLARKASKRFEILGVDIIKPTLGKEIASAKLQFHLLPPGEFPDTGIFLPQSFDAVTSMYGVEYADLEKTLKWLSGRLVPGGRAALIIHHKDSVIVKVAQAEFNARVITHDSKILQNWRTAIHNPSAENLALLRASSAVMNAAIEKMLPATTPWDKEGLIDLLGAKDMVDLWLQAIEEGYPASKALAMLDRYENVTNSGTKLKELLVEKAGIYGKEEEQKLRDLFTKSGFKINHLSPLQGKDGLLGWQVQLQNAVNTETVGASLGKVTRRNFLKFAAAGGAAGLIYTFGTKLLTEAQDGVQFEPSRESYRFAPKYPRADLMTSADVRGRFIREYLTNEGRFHQAGVSYNGVSGLTFDGHSIDFNSGVLRGTPRNWSASSKESLHVGLLALAVLNEDERVKLFIAQDNPSQAVDRALDILTRKITSYEKFNRDFPGFGGFLPWFLVTDGGMQPTHDWQTRVPALDNGQLAWSLYLAYQVLKEKGHDALARRYKAQFDLMAQNALKIFYEADGKIRAEARIADTRAVPVRANYSNNIADYFLDDPYEGELMAFFMTLFGDWANFGGAAEIDKIWRLKRRKLEAVDFRTPQGLITVQKGHWFSAHEQWKYLVLPYVNDPTARKIFENGERARTWHSSASRIPGLFASVHATVTGNDNPAYISALGIQAIARQVVDSQDVITPYAAFPVILAGPAGLGASWLHLMLSANRMQGLYGSTESINVIGTQIAPLLTWDGKVTTVAAMLGGFHQQIARYLRQDGKLDRFLEIVRREHHAVFTNIRGENIPFAPPTAEIPKAISDFASGRSLGESIPGKIKFQIMPDKKSLAKEVALRLVEAVKENPKAVLGLATGGTMEDVYKEVIELFKSDTEINFSEVVTFNLDEYLGLAPTNPQSYRAYMEKHLFGPLREKHADEAFQRENTFVFDGLAEDPEKEVERFLEEIRKRGGIDWQLLGIGKDGHFAFVEPAAEPDTLEKIRDFNDFMISESIPESELPEHISQILAKRSQARGDLAAFSDLMEPLVRSRQEYYRANGLSGEIDVNELKAELNIFGRRLLESQDTTFYISNFSADKAGDILDKIPEPLRKHVHIKDRSEFFSAGAKLVSLAIPTLLDNSRYFNNVNAMKLKALTLAGEVLNAREIVLAATGTKKAEAIRDSLVKPLSPAVTSSVFQRHRNTRFIVDEDAASLVDWIPISWDSGMIEALMKIPHPSIPAFRKNEATGAYEIKRLRGKKLIDWIRESKDLSGGEFLKQMILWTIQITEALRQIHAQDLFHGDVHPRNIVIETGTKNPVLFDFDDPSTELDLPALKRMISRAASIRNEILDPALVAILRNYDTSFGEFARDLKKYYDQRWPAAEGASLGKSFQEDKVEALKALSEINRGHHPIEQGISRTVQLLNGIPFIYTNGWSHSGMWKDHYRGEGHGDFLSSDFRYLADHLKNQGFYAGTDEAGFVHFRVNPEDSRWPALLKELKSITSVRVEKSKKMNTPETDQILIVDLPEEIKAKGPMAPEYDAYLEQKWDEVEAALIQWNEQSDAASLGKDRSFESIIPVAVKVTNKIFAKDDVALLGDVLEVMLGVGIAHADVPSPAMIAPGISADQLAHHLIRNVIPRSLPDGPVAVVVTESMKEDYVKALKDVIREGDLIVVIDNPDTTENILPLLRSITRGKKVVVKSLATASPLAAELEMKLKGYSARFSLEELNDSIAVPTTKKELIHFEVNQKLLSDRHIDVHVVTSLLRRLAQVKDPATRRQVFEQAGLQRIDDQHWIVGEGLAQIISKLQDELAGHQATARAA